MKIPESANGSGYKPGHLNEESWLQVSMSAPAINSGKGGLVCYAAGDTSPFPVLIHPPPHPSLPYSAPSVLSSHPLR